MGIFWRTEVEGRGSTPKSWSLGSCSVFMGYFPHRPSMTFFFKEQNKQVDKLSSFASFFSAFSRCFISFGLAQGDKFWEWSNMPFNF